MRQESQNAEIQEERSLKELILLIREWYLYYLKKWPIIVIFGLIGSAIGLTYAFFQKYKYQASLTFVVEDNKSGTLSSYAGIASQLGIDFGGAGGNGVFTGDNILEFLRSRLMIERALLSADPDSTESQSIADLYMKVSSVGQKLRKKPELASIRLSIDSSKTTTILKDSLLQILYEDITENHLYISKLDKKLSFISVSCISPNERFAKIFVERLVKEAIDFYVATKIQRSKSNVEKLQARADSLELLLDKKTYSVAANQDLNQNPARRVATVASELGSRDKLVLQTMYGEVVKNLELSKMSMAQETPIIQIIDRPKFPLIKKKFGKLKGLILGGVLAGIIILIFLGVLKVYRTAMSTDNSKQQV